MPAPGDASPHSTVPKPHESLSTLNERQPDPLETFRWLPPAEYDWEQDLLDFFNSSGVSDAAQNSPAPPTKEGSSAIVDGKPVVGRPVTYIVSEARTHPFLKKKEKQSFTPPVTTVAPMLSIPSYTDFYRRIHAKLESLDLSQLTQFFELALAGVTEDVMDFSMALLSLFYRIFHITKFSDVLFAALDFIRSVFGTSFIIEASKTIYSFLSESVTMLFNKLMLVPLRAEASPIETLQGIRSNFGMIVNSDIVSSLRDFILSLVSFKVFEKETSKSIISSIGPPKPCSGLELADTILQTAITFLTFGSQIASGQSINSILMNSDPVQTFISEVTDLSAIKDLTYSGLPVDGFVCRREYLANVTKAVAAGEQLTSIIPHNAPQRKSIDASLKTIRLIKAQFMNMMNGESRPTPFVVCIEGLPGIGKGLLVDYVSMIWSDVKGRTFDANHVYHRNGDEDYWSGYEPASKPIIHYSEPGAIHRSIAAKSGDPTISELLKVADNQPYMVNMADVESKGKVYATPEFVIMDCNDPTMNIDVLVNNPSAVKRRILYLKPTVKKEFLKEGTCRMDQAKSLASDTPKLDRWTFNLYRMEPENLQKSHHVSLLEGSSIYTLSSKLRSMFIEHIMEQEERLKIAPAIDIKDYYEKINSESFPLGRKVLVADLSRHPFNFRRHEISWKSSEYLLYIFLYSIRFLVCCAIALFLWLWPQNVFLKLMSVRSAGQQLSYSKKNISYYWNRLRLHYGYQAHFEIAPPMSYNAYVFIAGLTGLTIFYKLVKTSIKLTEGSVLSTSKDRTEAEVDSELEKISSDSESSMPVKRTKRGNGIDWDSVSRPIPEPVVATERQKDSEEDVISSVYRNVRNVIVDGKRSIETRATGVYEDIAIINRHAFNEADNGIWHLSVSLTSKVNTSVRKVIVNDNDLSQIADDLFLVRLRGCKFKDIRSLVAVDYYKTPVYGARSYFDGESTSASSTGSIVVHDQSGPIRINQSYTYKHTNHRVGICGTPLLASFAGGFGVIGFHVGGSNNSPDSYSQAMCLTDINKAADSLKKKQVLLGVFSQGKIRLPLGTSISDGITYRSPLNFEDVPGLSVFGALSGYCAMKLGKSKLTTSPFIHYAEELTGVNPFVDGKPLFAAPPFSHVVRNGEYKAPYNNFVKKAGVVKNSLHPEILSATIELITGHVLKGLKERGVTKLSPLELSVANNGHPDDFYMRSVKPSTSGGWAWPGSKAKYSEKLELPFKKDAFMPLFDVKEQVVEQLNAYSRHEDSLPILGAQLKDEPRSYEKVLAAKTRVFCMSPYESTLVNRMYLMPFYSLMVEHGDIFSTSIGINMHSTDVDELIQDLDGFSQDDSRFMEGDYSGYDTSMPYDIGLAANTVVYNVLKSLGYSKTALNYVRGILSDNLFPTIMMRGDLFAAPALQPSGKYATAEDNSLRGLIMLAYAWIATCTPIGAAADPALSLTTKFSPEDFYKQLKCVIYGDDMLAAVKPPARLFFNNNTYQSFCRAVFGLDFTNALKTLEMSDFLTLPQISFLKRTFVFREDLGHWVAPLDRASIMKSIVYYLPSKNVSREDQLVDSCVSALRELFFHTGADDYEDLRQTFIRRTCDALGVSEEVGKKFPRFDEIERSVYGDIVPEEELNSS